MPIAPSLVLPLENQITWQCCSFLCIVSSWKVQIEQWELLRACQERLWNDMRLFTHGLGTNITVNNFVQICVEEYVPTKTIWMFPNHKLWITRRSISYWGPDLGHSYRVIQGCVRKLVAQVSARHHSQISSMLFINVERENIDILFVYQCSPLAS